MQYKGVASLCFKGAGQSSRVTFGVTGVSCPWYAICREADESLHTFQGILSSRVKLAGHCGVQSRVCHLRTICLVVLLLAAGPSWPILSFLVIHGLVIRGLQWDRTWLGHTWLAAGWFALWCRSVIIQQHIAAACPPAWVVAS